MPSEDIVEFTDDQLLDVLNQPAFNIDRFAKLTPGEQNRLIAMQQKPPNEYLSGLAEGAATPSRETGEEGPQSFLGSVLSGAGGMATGFGKEALNTAFNLADMVNASPVGYLNRAVANDLGIDDTQLQPHDDIPLDGRAEEIGGGIERVAEFMVPGGAFRRGGASLANRGASALSRAMRPAANAGARARQSIPAVGDAARSMSPRMSLGPGPVVPGNAVRRARSAVNVVPRMTGGPSGLDLTTAVGRALGDTASAAGVSALRGNNPDIPASVAGAGSLLGSAAEKFIEVPLLRRLMPVFAGALGAKTMSQATGGGGGIGSFGMFRELGKAGLERSGVAPGVGRLGALAGRAASGVADELQSPQRRKLTP